MLGIDVLKIANYGELVTSKEERGEFFEVKGLVDINLVFSYSMLF